VQDGGAVLGFSFYDLWARLRYLGPDNAWQRLGEILDWEKDVHREGGYRKYYEGGKRGTTLQGGGTAGGLGIDYEFFESSLVPSIVVYGFLGIDARPDDRLVIAPRLPKACPRMSLSNLFYKQSRMDIRAADDGVTVTVKDKPLTSIRLCTEPKGRVQVTCTEPGTYRLDIR
jgi:hypothetical protein